MRQRTRREFLSTIGRGVAGAGLLAAAPWARAAETAKQPNVLFLALDDLRTQLGCYGHEQMISPNIDKLAAAGTRFDRTYCQQAVCGPSRASLLTGLRPDSTRIYGLQTPVRKALPNVLSLPEHFKNHGYTTCSLGKIYHHRDDDRVGWSTPPARASGAWKGRGYLDPASQKAIAEQTDARKKRRGVGPAFEAPDVADDDYADGKNTNLAIARLRKWARTGERFFLALGYYKPHLPFNAPKRYWDLYPPEKVRLPAQTDWPEDVPKIALMNWGELRQYAGIPAKGRCPEALTRELIRGYCACVTYTDALIGRVLAELDRLGLRDNTVIVLWGDHGWKLGEYSAWCKHSNFELDTHVPMIFAGPGVPKAVATPALTEFVDIYPTLCELCGLDVPKHCEGTSAVGAMKNPKRPWKSAAFSQYPRGKVMGYSMRTARYRYTRWVERKGGKVVARELYDHATSPVATVNLAGRADHAELVKKLDAQCAAGYRAARPTPQAS